MKNLVYKKGLKNLYEFIQNLIFHIFFTNNRNLKMDVQGFSREREKPRKRQKEKFEKSRFFGHRPCSRKIFSTCFETCSDTLFQTFCLGREFCKNKRIWLVIKMVLKITRASKKLVSGVNRRPEKRKKRQRENRSCGLLRSPAASAFLSG